VGAVLAAILNGDFSGQAMPEERADVRFHDAFVVLARGFVWDSGEEVVEQLVHGHLAGIDGEAESLGFFKLFDAAVDVVDGLLALVGLAACGFGAKLPDAGLRVGLEDSLVPDSLFEVEPSRHLDAGRCRRFALHSRHG
jgi:hypothetical protein